MRSDPPPGDEVALAVLVHVELLDLDLHFEGDVVGPPRAEPHLVGGDHRGQIGGEHALKPMVQPFGPERAVEILDFARAFADGKRCSHQVAWHFRNPYAEAQAAGCTIARGRHGSKHKMPAGDGAWTEAASRGDAQGTGKKQSTE